MSEKWDLRYLELAKLVSTWSKDPRKQVGAVIVEDQYVRGVGFNGFPRHIDDEQALLDNRELKLQLIVHAEVNSILAARGRGDTCYVWPQEPCPQCAGLLIQAGIRRVVTSKMYDMVTSWNRDMACRVLSQAGVEVSYV